jgi:hypothetical protein
MKTTRLRIQLSRHRSNRLHLEILPHKHSFALKVFFNILRQNPFIKLILADIVDYFTPKSIFYVILAKKSIYLNDHP